MQCALYFEINKYKIVNVNDTAVMEMNKCYASQFRTCRMTDKLCYI